MSAMERHVLPSTARPARSTGPAAAGRLRPGHHRAGAARCRGRLNRWLRGHHARSRSHPDHYGDRHALAGGDGDGDTAGGHEHRARGARGDHATGADRHPTGCDGDPMTVAVAVAVVAVIR